jgi:hypothetical protein
MTTPDYVEASLTLAPDGAAPVFHMVRLPDSVVFVQVIRRANSYLRSLRLVGDNLNSVLTAWPNNDTGHGNVFVAKSSDDGRTISKTIVLRTPNIEHVIDQNPSIAASVYVYVPWWTNESGVLEPVSRASNDGGNTFCPMAKLNNTSTKSTLYFILFFS